MTKDAYWDELGIAWCAVHPETEVIIPRLRASLRGQSFLIAAYVFAGLLLGLAGALLGAYTLWRSWTFGPWSFVVRGAVLLAISGMMAVAGLELLPVMRGDQARALPEMIDLAIVRAQRLLLAVRLGLLACAVTAVFALLGSAIRIFPGKVPPNSPILLYWVVLAALALGFFFYGRHINLTRRKFRYLKEALAMDGV